MHLYLSSGMTHGNSRGAKRGPVLASGWMKRLYHRWLGLPFPGFAFIGTLMALAALVTFGQLGRILDEGFAFVLILMALGLPALFLSERERVLKKRS